MSEEDLRRGTTAYFHEQIPITREMGVEVESYRDGALVLRAPLEPNHNHLGTAFGGSLSAIATLAGYGLLWLWLGDRNVHIVVTSSSIRYHQPVTGTIRATCRLPDQATLEAFRDRFDQKGKARLELQVTIGEAGELCVEFEGVFAARR